MSQRTPEEIASDVIDALHWSTADGYDAIVASALRSAVEAEREACAKVADGEGAHSYAAHHIAKTIRARGKA